MLYDNTPGLISARFLVHLTLKTINIILIIIANISYFKWANGTSSAGASYISLYILTRKYYKIYNGAIYISMYFTQKIVEIQQQT
jgi:hypothetical protein